MKIYTHNFLGYGHVPSSCEVRISREEGDGKTWICFVNTGNGTSVTNASEEIATEILDKENLDPQNCRFFEWYPENDHIDSDFASVDEITYIWDGKKASYPYWEYFCHISENPFK
jgi:hypothetical protein